MEDRFQQVESEYFRLRGQFSTGRLTREQFENALRELMIADANGRYWMLGTDTGKWYVHDGGQWVEANPPLKSAPTAPSNVSGHANAAPIISQPAPIQYTAPPAPPPRGGCGRTLLIGCLVLFVACALVGGGGYLALTNGMISQKTLLNLAGLGPGAIVVNNFRDDAVTTEILELDTKQDQYPAQRTLELNAFDVKQYASASPARYRVTFTVTQNNQELGTCTLRVHSGDEYQFVVLPERIAVNRVNTTVERGSELLIASSILCRAQ